MSIDHQNTAISKEDNKRLSSDRECENDNENETGEIALEEGEIDDDDDEGDGEQIKSTTTKKANKRKRKHRSRKRFKETVVYDVDVYSFDIDNTKESPDKKPKTEEAPKAHIQSLLSLNLMNDDNTFNTKSSSTDSNSSSDSNLPALPPPPTTYKSLHELFGVSNSTTTSAFIDPTITEKENSKPKQEQQQVKDEQQKMTKKQRQAAGIVSKKDLKKQKHFEMMKQREKKREQAPPKIQEICKFYLEGRCTKGNECTFSHNAEINKKFEVCKYYLSGYCAKNEQCTFMHAEFPCKFYHTNKKECKMGATCKFSHAPMTSEMREAFVKYLKEIGDEISASTVQSSSSSSSPQSLFVSPPSALPAIPSLMDLPVPAKKQPQQPVPSLMSDIKPTPAPTILSLFSQDIDMRAVAAAPIDIDERAARTTTTTAPVVDNFFKMLEGNPFARLGDVSSIIPEILKVAATTSLNKPPPPLLSSLLGSIKTESYIKQEMVDTECVEIDGRTDGTLPYRAVLIDIPQSSLWTNLPHSEPGDPRIEFYSNRSNNKRNQETSIANTQQAQQQLNLNTFTTTTSASALSPPQLPQQNHKVQTTTTTAKEYRDPRLVASKASTEAPSLNDLLSLQNQILNPKQQPQQQHQQKSTYNKPKLSIDDYKRKTQGPPSSSSSFNYNNNRNTQQQNVAPPAAAPPSLSYAPPSYSVGNLTSLGDLKAPQSLHELLKNYPS